MEIPYPFLELASTRRVALVQTREMFVKTKPKIACCSISNKGVESIRYQKGHIYYATKQALLVSCIACSVLLYMQLFSLFLTVLFLFLLFLCFFFFLLLLFLLITSSMIILILHPPFLLPFVNRRCLVNRCAQLRTG